MTVFIERGVRRWWFPLSFCLILYPHYSSCEGCITPSQFVCVVCNLKSLTTLKHQVFIRNPDNFLHRTNFYGLVVELTTKFAPHGQPGVPFASVCHYRMGRADFTHSYCGMDELLTCLSVQCFTVIWGSKGNCGVGFCMSRDAHH